MNVFLSFWSQGSLFLGHLPRAQATSPWQQAVGSLRRKVPLGGGAEAPREGFSSVLGKMLLH